MISTEYHVIVTPITVGDFLSKFELVQGFTVESFLQYVLIEDTTDTNRDRIRLQYSEDQAKIQVDGTSSDQIIILAGTVVGLPNTSKRRDIISSKIQPDLFQQTNFTAFISKQLYKLFKDPKYYSEIKSYDGRDLGKVDISTVTVYAWIRSLSRPGSKSQEGAWIDLSPYVQTIQTSVSSGVGSFNMILKPITAQYDKTEGWVIVDEISSLITRGQLREKHFFNIVLQENDLIFIKFEKLVLEKTFTQPAFGPHQVPNHIYDMIGLVDKVGISTGSDNVGISVNGRDLMKMLIEDGSYFFIEQFAQDIFTDSLSLLAKRNKIEAVSSLLVLAASTYKPIDVIVKFLFNKFSNLGIVPNSVLSNYSSKAIKDKYLLTSSALKSGVLNDVLDQVNDLFKNEERQGVWRIIDLIFDPQIAQRILSDSTVVQDNGSIINSIRKLCQEPFVEFYGDTYGDRYVLICRKPPIDAKGYRGLCYDDILSELPTSTHKDSSATVKQNQQTKVENKNINQGRLTSLSNLVIDIEESEILSDDLSYSNEAYSWYRLIPRGLIPNIDNEAGSFASLALSPLIPFDEYAEVWGSKQLTIEQNYAPLSVIEDSQQKDVLKWAEQQVFLDLQFLIQSYAYLPFTREGTLRIVGNRTIKRGMFVYCKPTQEVFLVDGVVNTRTPNDRITTLKVSRGMRESFIKGKTITFPGNKKKLVSYFDIINTTIANNASINNKEFLKNWKVDRDIFNFFLQRRQWDSRYENRL